jgi:DNA-binding CsgD family transcriptional regulator
MTQQPLQPLKASLTRRELEVAKLIADDLTDRQIAIQLNIKVGTVRTITHMARLKLNVRGRVGLALWYFQRHMAA